MTVPIQQQLVSFWNKQTTTQKITLIVLVIAVAVLVPLFLNWATQPTYAVAFSGMSETDAGQVVDKLAASNIPYKLNGTGTILVPQNQVYEVRLQMAKEGLPSSGTVGLEVFSGSTLGMTEFTQKVNYQRALEGELERTIGSMTAVNAVRVHIVTPEKTLLSSEQPETTASVMLQINPGKALDQAQVQAITHLVASSIEGLKAENVVVVDSSGKMLASGSGSSDEAGTAAQTDSRRAAEASAALALQQKAENILNQVLGPNRAVVQVDVSLDWTQKETKSMTYQPTPAAIRSSQKTTENYSTTGSSPAGVPGAASNLPTPVATSAASGGSSTYARTDEILNYEITNSETHEVVTPGSIKRISLSVLVDKVTDEAQLTTLKNAVAAAVGIDSTRGDTLVVENTTFDKTYVTTQTEDLTKASQTEMYWRIGEIAGAVILLFILLFYVQRLLKNLKLASSDAWVPVMKPLSEAALSAPSASPMIGSGMLGAQLAGLPGIAQQPAMETSPRLEQVMKPRKTNPEDEVLQKALTRMTEDNPASVAEIIQMWLAEDEKHS
jgi:flagellar M-ring protein FliF